MLPKTYDANGTTCHQCRQKTQDRKTECTQCHSISGQFCGMCLQLRYGENLDEVLQAVESGGEWICPVCRDICNCSICRTRKHWAPTGILAPYIQDYPSVAHYLVNKYLIKKDESSETPEGKNPPETSSPQQSLVDQQQTSLSEQSSSEKKQMSQEMLHETEMKSQKEEPQHGSPQIPNKQEDDEDTPTPQNTQSEHNSQDSETETSDSSFQHPDESEDDEKDVYPVEKIVAHRCVGGGRRLQYKVRWKGYAPESDTWEPEENLTQCQDEINEYWVGRFGSIEPLQTLHKKMTVYSQKHHNLHQ